jgi:hypothetical protein
MYIREKILWSSGSTPSLSFWEAALSSDGSEIWATETGLRGGPGASVYEVDYRSGSASFSFPVNDFQEFFLIIGMAVSPTYYPAQ